MAGCNNLTKFSSFFPFVNSLSFSFPSAYIIGGVDNGLVYPFFFYLSVSYTSFAS
jgi:hypothetical protein